MEKQIILMPINEDEEERYATNFADIYVLYKDHDKINIGIPYLSAYIPVLANVFGIHDDTNVIKFYNGGSELEINAKLVIDRPVYKIIPTDERTINNITILNDVEIELDDLFSKNEKHKYVKQ